MGKTGVWSKRWDDEWRANRINDSRKRRAEEEKRRGGGRGRGRIREYPNASAHSHTSHNRLQGWIKSETISQNNHKQTVTLSCWRKNYSLAPVPASELPNVYNQPSVHDSFCSTPSEGWSDTSERLQHMSCVHRGRCAASTQSSWCDRQGPCGETHTVQCKAAGDVGMSERNVAGSLMSCQTGD